MSPWLGMTKDRVRTLAGGWRAHGSAFVEAGRFNLGELTTAWPDQAGTAYQTRPARI